MKRIYYEPDEIWGLVLTSPNATTLVAENGFGVQVFVLSYPDETTMLVVTDSMAPIEQDIIDPTQAKELAEDLYDTYLDDFDGFDVPEKENHGKKISEREEELNLALEDFICAVTEDVFFYDDDSERTEKIKDRILEVLYKEFDINPYRPMMLVDEIGKELYEEYPYELLYE